MRIPRLSVCLAASLLLLVHPGTVAQAFDPQLEFFGFRAGASLVQIYSAMVFEGPGLAGRIARGLERLAARDGFAKVSDAVGTEG